MKHKLALAVGLCLAVTALLAVGASPALGATTCAECHAAPPDGPPAPHGVLVAAVTDCTTCHAGMSPHPEALRTPKLTLKRTSSTEGDALSGQLSRPGIMGVWAGVPDVTVYLQQRLWGATDFTDITQVTTSSAADAMGTFAYTVPTPAAFAAYRAIAHGFTATTLFGGPYTWRPGTVTLLPKPKVTLVLGGVKAGVLKLGTRLKMSGTVAPAGLSAEKVRLVVMKRGSHRWFRVTGVRRAISATDTYVWRYRPTSRGSYRIRANVAETEMHRLVTTSWKKFRVK